MTVYVIVQRTTEKEYVYGGWGDDYRTTVDLLGYATTQEEAEAYLDDLKAAEAKARKKRGSRSYDYREFEFEILSEIS